MTCKVSPKCASILEHLYQKIETLEDYANGFAHVRSNGNLIQADDSHNYTRLLQSTLVCIPPGARCPMNVSPEVLSSQDDILERVIERLCKNSKKNQGKNLLTLGFQSLSENPHAQILPSSRIECTFTNHNVSRLLLTPWKTLLSRVGDTVMEILLEHRAVLILADNSCYIQLTGVPLYNLISFKSSVPDVAKNRTKFWNNISQPKRRENFKLKKKSKYKMLTKPCFVPLVTDTCSNMIVDHRDVEKNSEENNNDFNTVGILNKSNNSVDNVDAEKRLSCRKRNIDVLVDDECCSVKKRRLDNSSTEGTNFKIDTHEQSDHYLDQKEVDLIKRASERLCTPSRPFDGCLNSSESSSCASFVSACESFSPCKQRNKITNLYLTVRKDTNIDDQIVNVEEFDNSLSPITFGLYQTAFVTLDSSVQVARGCEPGNSNREEVVHVENDLNNDVEYTKKRRRNKKKYLDTSEPESKFSFNHSMTIERARMMYSMNLAENYPPRYVFPKSCKTNIDGNELLADILKVNVQSEDECLNNEVKLPTVVKTRLVSMLDRFIKNHRTCRFKYLLRFHACSLHESMQFHLKHKLRKKCKNRKKSVSTRDIQKEKNKQNVVPISDASECLSAVKQLQSARRYPGLIEGNVSVYRRGGAKRDDIPVPQVMTNTKETGSESACSDLVLGSILSRVIHHRKVFLFVRACLMRVVPHELFGSIHNRNVFFKNVKRIISMRRFDKYSLGSLMLHMQPKCLWKSEIKSNHERLRLFAQILYWLMVSYVIPLLQSYFYVTDSAEGRNHTFYFRKIDWRHIFQAGFANYLKRGILKPLTTKEINSIYNTENQSEFATFRFFPKQSSLRPIISVSVKRSLGVRNKKSLMNWQLKDVLHVLKYETKQNPSIIGSSVFSRDEIYIAWKKFILNRRKRQDTRPLYFVKVDIKNCYDSIDKQKLYKIVEDLLSEFNTYKLRCYSRVFSEGGRLRRIFETDACALGSYQPSFLKYVSNFVEAKKAGNSVFVDQCLQFEFHSHDLLDILRKHLFECVIKINNKYYLQAEGISQGSVLSTMLCNIYYGDMESKHLKLNKEEELLMRLVDDFIFVTPDIFKANEFVRRMNDGIPEYGCFVNKAKTLVTFDYIDETVKRLPKGFLFPWCGLLIDTECFDIRADYTPYKGICISDSVSIDTSVSPGKSMQQKLLFAMRGKCHAIFLDASINSLPVIVENIFHIFLLSAFKFHSYVTRLPVPESANKNPDFLVKVVLETSLFLWRRLIRLKCILGWLNEPCIRWLCIKSYVLKLKCHFSAYNRVLKILKKLLKDLESVMNEIIVNNLQSVVGDAMPENFRDIMN